MLLAIRTPQPINPTPDDPTAPLLGGRRAPDPSPPAPAPAPTSPAPTPDDAPVLGAAGAATDGAVALFDRIGAAQARTLQGHQAIAFTSALFGARMSAIGSHVLGLLRGAREAD